MIDFPANPTVGQTFQGWEWDGVKWISAPSSGGSGGSGGASITVSDTPPPNPTQGALWWESVNGQMYVFYTDVNSSQWVPTTNQMGGGYATTAYVDAARLGANRIINGDMRIDQRNNGAAGTATNVYTVDRWVYNASQASKGTWQRAGGGAVMLGYGFGYALIFTSSSAYASLAGDQFYFRQIIEADMITDFAWGTSGAQPVTLSFWVNSSLTGTFSGAIQSFPVPPARCYPFTFSIPVASTWTKITVTIPGDTAGTWVMSGNLAGVGLAFDLGSGSTFRAPPNAWANGNFTGANGAVSVVSTNGATFYVTGVKLEIGSIATPFNRKSPQENLADCERYYQTGQFYSYAVATAAGQTVSASSLYAPMRVAPTIAITANNSNNVGAPTASANPNMIYTYGAASAAGQTFLNIAFSATAEL